MVEPKAELDQALLMLDKLSKVKETLESKVGKLGDELGAAHDKLEEFRASAGIVEKLEKNWKLQGMKKKGEG